MKPPPPAEVSFKPVDNRRLANLCGALDENLRQIEAAFEVVIVRRGGSFTLAGEPERTRQAAQALRNFYSKAGDDLSVEDVQLGLIEVARGAPPSDGGNTSTLNDGAAAMLVTSTRMAAHLGLKPMARILACASAGVDPRVMGIGPVPAVERCLHRAGLSTTDVGLWELNEAFAAQSLAVIRMLDLPMDRVNVKGGAIALGHPLGMSGARIVTTLVHTMRERNVRYGVATLCVGVGQGVATLFECLED